MKIDPVMKVYIAGKVSGLPIGETFIKFAQAEWWLKEQGHEAVNPLRLCSAGWGWEKCMRVCLAELLKCDAICLLKDWGDSPGAVTEYYVASRLGMRVMVFVPRRATIMNTASRDAKSCVSAADKTEEL